MKSDPLAVIEQAYDMSAPAPRWLDRLSHSVNEQLGAGLGAQSFTYELTPEGRLLVGELKLVGLPDSMTDPTRQMLESLSPTFVRATLARCGCTSQSQLDPEVAELIRPIELCASIGWHDMFFVAGSDPSSRGVFFAVGFSEPREIPARVTREWGRVAVHLATAHRLRRRLARAANVTPDTADAILTPGGRVEHAHAEAVGARERLKRAVAATERARGPLRAKEPDQALEQWKALVAGRWTLVDHWESDGKRYVLARRNDVSVSGLASLSSRERQAVAFTSLGHTNKLIAYEMGLSASTVGVLLHRAAKKLQATTRDEMIARFAPAREDEGA